MSGQMSKVPKKLLYSRYFDSASDFNVMNGSMHKHFPLHWHEFYEIELIFSGEGQHILNGVSHPVKPGTLYMLTPADFHEVVAEEGTLLGFHNVKFTDEMLNEELRDILFQQQGVLSVDLTETEYPLILEQFIRLDEESRSSKPLKKMMVKGLLDRILIGLVRKLDASAPVARQAHSVNLTPQMQCIQKALMYIQHYFRESISLEAVAKQSNLSPGYFSECFHATTGCAFSHYVQCLRLQFAASLLASSDLHVTEVCYASGFNTLSHFVRAFKNKYHLSPGTFRKKSV